MAVSRRLWPGEGVGQDRAWGRTTAKRQGSSEARVGLGPAAGASRCSRPGGQWAAKAGSRPLCLHTITMTMEPRYSRAHRGPQLQVPTLRQGTLQASMFFDKRGIACPPQGERPH